MKIIAGAHEHKNKTVKFPNFLKKIIYHFNSTNSVKGSCKNLSTQHISIEGTFKDSCITSYREQQIYENYKLICTLLTLHMKSIFNTHKSTETRLIQFFVKWKAGILNNIELKILKEN